MHWCASRFFCAGKLCAVSCRSLRHWWELLGWQVGGLGRTEGQMPTTSRRFRQSWSCCLFLESIFQGIRLQQHQFHWAFWRQSFVAWDSPKWSSLPASFSSGLSGGLQGEGWGICMQFSSHATVVRFQYKMRPNCIFHAGRETAAFWRIEHAQYMSFCWFQQCHCQDAERGQILSSADTWHFPSTSHTTIYNFHGTESPCNCVPCRCLRPAAFFVLYVDGSGGLGWIDAHAFQNRIFSRSTSKDMKDQSEDNRLLRTRLLNHTLISNYPT